MVDELDNDAAYGYATGRTLDRAGAKSRQQ